MPKQAREMTATELRRLSKPGAHAVGGVPGLYVNITETGAKHWILRTTVGVRRREFGLGGFPEVGLASARDKARDLREQIRQGVDPIEQRKAARARLEQATARGLSFEVAAKRCHKVKAQEFKNSKHAAQWINTLDKYVFPALGKQPVAEIDTPQVLAVLQPIWGEIPETASRVRQRMAAVFDWARAAKIRTAPNPAAWQGCLEPLLPKTDRLRKTAGKAKRHHPALPVSEVPRFMADMATRDTPSAYALRFAILTGARSGEARLATWDEIDLDARVWRLPADRMKEGQQHTVPLSDAAIEILEAMPKDNPAGLVFPNSKGVELSNTALSKLMKDAHAADLKQGGIGYLDPRQNRIATPHGTARSSFKEWSRQGGRFPDEWSELALAHVNSDQTRAAYARSELLEERRGMMEAWGSYCEPKGKGGNVVVAQFQK
ncbi:MAG: integrase [Haliea sp.]|nr:integrase [Haliea sp.]|tara:strand:- start:32787 stop:34088 length:1302 start_codon:yes stop_codon:yes gene_type:complete